MNNKHISGIKDPIERARIRTISNMTRGDVYFQNGDWHNQQEIGFIRTNAQRIDSKKKLQDILDKL
jgi:hypothetical protein